jgi:hypothetical protein
MAKAEGEIHDILLLHDGTEFPDAAPKPSKFALTLCDENYHKFRRDWMIRSSDGGGSRSPGRSHRRFTASHKIDSQTCAARGEKPNAASSL